MLNQKGEKGEFGKKNFKYSEEFYDKFIKQLGINYVEVLENDMGLWEDLL